MGSFGGAKIANRVPQDKLKKAKEKELKEILVGIGVSKIISDDIITSVKHWINHLL